MCEAISHPFYPLDFDIATEFENILEICFVKSILLDNAIPHWTHSMGKIDGKIVSFRYSQFELKVVNRDLSACMLSFRKF